MLRGALWPAEGDRDAVIHAGPTDCPLYDFANDTFDGSIVEVWNRRAALSDQAARIAELETELYLLRNDRANKADQIYDLETSLTASRAECEGLRAALEEIANPLDTMRRRAAETGRRLDGAIANTLANDANHLKQIARSALSQKETGNAA